MRYGRSRDVRAARQRTPYRVLDMNRNILVFVLLLAAVMPPLPARSADAPQSVTVAVLNFAGPRRTLANNIASLIGVDLSSDPHLTLIDRAELDKILGEQALGQSGNITPESAAKIGKLTGAKILITGREFSPADARDIFIVIANVIGTETGRVFSQSEQGKVVDQVTVIENLSRKIQQVISRESSNLLAQATEPQAGALDDTIARLKGRTLPTVSIDIREKIAGQSAETHVAETELGRVFQKAGFTLVDGKSATNSEVVITGDAITGPGMRNNNLFSCLATVELKVVERKTGNVLTLDLQRGTASDVSASTASAQALQRAADDLAARLLPIFAK